MFIHFTSFLQWMDKEIDKTYITILHPCDTQHDNGEKTSYTNDNSISGCWRQDSKAVVEFLFFFGHVFG